MKAGGKLVRLRVETSRIGAAACVIVMEKLSRRVKSPKWRRN